MPKVDTSSALLDSSLSDEQWLTALHWRKGTPAAIVDAARKGDSARFAKALHENSIVSKKRQARLAESLRVLYWSDPLNGPLAQLIAASSASTSDDLDTRVSNAIQGHGLMPAPPLEVISGLAIQLTSTAALSAATCVSLWRWCVVQSTLWIEEQSAEGEPTSLADLLSVTELPLLAGIALPHLKQTKKWTSSGQKGWGQWSQATTDTDGTLDSHWLSSLLPLLQALGRSETYLQLGGTSLLDGKFTTVIQTLVSRCLCLATPGRLATLSTAETGTIQDLAAAISALGFKKGNPIRRLLGLYCEPETQGRRLGVRNWDLPEKTHQSDWAEWACLRTSWDADLDQVLVRHAESQPFLDVVLNGRPVFRGAWEAQLQLDGIPWNSTEWECSCVFTDDDADYIELQQTDADCGVTVTRQILLSKVSRGLFLVDAIKTSRPGELAYRWDLPFAGECVPATAGVNGQPSKGEPRFEFDALTREAAAQLGDLRLRLFPIGWPQDRFSPLQGKLNLDRRGLAMEMRTQGTGLCLPLFLDWHPPRRDTPCDWTVLTVAEDGQTKSKSEALGSRLRLGREQWLYFHNIVPGALPRTVLGHHTMYETVIARIKRGGEVVPLVQVDTE